MLYLVNFGGLFNCLVNKSLRKRKYTKTVLNLNFNLRALPGQPRNREISNRTMFLTATCQSRAVGIVHVRPRTGLIMCHNWSSDKEVARVSFDWSRCKIFVFFSLKLIHFILYNIGIFFLNLDGLIILHNCNTSCVAQNIVYRFVCRVSPLM